MPKKLKNILLAMTCLVSSWSFSQAYPLQVSAQMIPPYSLKLSDYTTAMNERIVATLLLTDVREQNMQIGIRLYIENGRNIAIQSSPAIQGATPLYITGGIPLRLSNLDLRPYFQLENLHGMSPQQYNQPLPDGLYQFCFEVYEWTSGETLSRKSCATAYLVLNDPPILNFPNKGELIAHKDPQNIIFQWTPRHLNATNVQYEFTLTELWDVHMDPQAAFLASRPLYQTTTRANTLLYGPGETALLPDKTYAWRVKALVSDGISETSVFKNGGYSEIFHFTHTGNCDEPAFILAKADSPTSEKIMWQGLGHLKYKIQFRKKAQEGGETKEGRWHEINSINEYVTLHNLEGGSTYEFRVGGQCNENAGYTYSQIYEFTTAIPNQALSYNCGITPEIEITNRELLQSLVVNDVFTAGDFPVTVKHISSSPLGGGDATGVGGGGFTGWGYIVVPYLQDTKVRVSFNNIKINTDYQFIEGIIETDYDPTWGGMDDIRDEIVTLENLANELIQAVNGLYENGEISETGRDSALGEIQSLTTELAGTKENLEEGTALIEKGKEEQNPESIEKGETKVAEASNAVHEVRQALQQKAKELGVSGGSGQQMEDSYFDGLISINVEGNIPVGVIDDTGTYNLSIKPADEEFVPLEPRSINIDGTNYTFVVTSTRDTDAYIKQARSLVENPKNGIVVYFHYDLEEKTLGYKVEFARHHFNNLNEQEYEEVKFTFKKGIANLVEAYNAAKEVEDWSVVVLEVTQGLNNRIKEAITDVNMPKFMWYPKDEDYRLQPAHFEPVVAGVIDGTIDEIKSIPQLVNILVDFSTDQQARSEMIKAFKDLDIEKAFNRWIAEKEEVYSGTDKELMQHEAGKDAVTVITTVGTLGVTTVTKAKKGVDFVKELAEKIKKQGKYKPEILDAINKVFSNIDSKILDKLIEVEGFEKVIKDMATNWNKFQGGKFVLKYANNLITNGKKIKFEVNDLSNDLRRIYDIVVEGVVNGQLISKRLELKNWSNFYPETIQNQFLKDLQKMSDLGDIKWIFNKTNGIDNIANLKSKVLASLKNTDGSPIGEIENILNNKSFQEKVKKWMNKAKDDVTGDDFLEWVEKEDNFNKIFEIVE